MPMIYNYATAHWIDKNGKRCETFWVTQDQEPGGELVYLPLVAAAQDCSDAGCIAIQFTSTTILDTAATDGDYPTVWDRAVFLESIVGTNQGTRLSIPGPKGDLFLPGRQLVDMSDPRVIALDAQAQDLLGNSTGNARGPFLSGIRATAAGS